MTRLAYALLLAAPLAAAEPRPAAATGTAAEELAARKLGVPRGALTGATTYDAAGAGGVDSIVVALVQAKGKPAEAVLVPIVRCDGAPCAGRPLHLGAATGVSPPLALDLEGPAQRLPASLLFEDPFLPARLAGAKRPALVLGLDDATKSRRVRTGVLAGLVDGALELLWSAELSLSTEKGGGFSTINEIELTRAEADQAVLDLEYAQTAMPGPGDAPYRPGPPRGERWVWKGGRYVRP